MTMELSSAYNKDLNDNDRLFSGDSCHVSDVARPPTTHLCAQFDISPPKAINKRSSPDVVRRLRSRSLERSSTDRVTAGRSLPRWDGISVWVPNTTTHRAGLRQPVQRRKTYTPPTQSMTPSPTVSSTAGSRSLSRGKELLTAAGNSLHRAWNRQTTKLIKSLSSSGKTSTRDEAATFQQHELDDREPTTLTICRRCRGRIIDDTSLSRSVANTPMQVRRILVAEPKLPSGNISGDVDTDSGYLIGRTTPNSPNDFISCRTLPSLSPDDVTGREDNPREANVVDLGTSGPIIESLASEDCGSVQNKGAQHPEDLLSWKMSLMDRINEPLPTARSSQNHDSTSSSEDDDDDDCSAKSAKDATDFECVSRCGTAAETQLRNKFCFENHFEEALEMPGSASARRANDDSEEEADDEDDVNKLFDAKLDELLHSRCDVMTDQLQSFGLKDDETQLKRRCTSSRSNNQRLQPGPQFSTDTDHVTSIDQSSASIPSIVVTNSLHRPTKVPVTQLGPPSSVRLLSRDRSAESFDREFVDHTDTDNQILCQSSISTSDSIPYIDDENHDEMPETASSRLSGCQFRSKSVPAGGRSRLRVNNGVWPGTNTQQDYLVSSLPRTNNHRRDDKRCSHADDGNEGRRAITWQKLRNVVDDAVVELVDSVRAITCQGDSRLKPEFIDADIARLRRRLLHQIHTAVWNDDDIADSSTRDTDHRDLDELHRLRHFVTVLLGSPEHDVERPTKITKYIMTCSLLGTGPLGQRHRRSGSQENSEIGVFLLQNGVKIDGLHVSVAGRSDLSVDTFEDCRIQSAFAGVRSALTTRAHYRSTSDPNHHYTDTAIDTLPKMDDLPPPPPEWSDN